MSPVQAPVLLLGFDEATVSALAAVLRDAGLASHAEADAASGLRWLLERDADLILIRAGDDESRLLQSAAVLSQDSVAGVLPLLVLGTLSEAGIESLAALREGPVDAVEADQPSRLARRASMMATLRRLQRREAHWQARLAFKQQEVDAERAGRYRAERAAARRSSRDPLTDLPNRNVFEDRLQTAIERAERSGRRLALLQVELRGLRPINEGYGHKVVDRLLVAVGQRIQDTVRRSDTVARLSGDGFGVIAEQLPDLAAVRALAEKLADVLTLPFLLPAEDGAEPNRVEIQTRVGIALYPDFDTAAALMQAADAAIARARAAGTRTEIAVSR